MVNGKLVCAIGMGLGLTFGGAAAALAQEQVAGWYIGGSIGESKIDADQDALDEEFVLLFEDMGASVLSGSSSIEDSDTAFALFAGYRFSPYFALEGGYQDLGVFSYRAEGQIRFLSPPGAFPVTTSIDIESSGFTFAGVASVPLAERFELHGKIGVLFADTELSVGARIVDTGETIADSASSQDFFYGLGVAYRFADAWSLSLDYQLFKDVGDEETTGEEDVDLLSLGFTYRF